MKRPSLTDEDRTAGRAQLRGIAVDKEQTPLLRRINERKPLPAREPEWMRRKREQGLPAKDLTSMVVA